MPSPGLTSEAVSDGRRFPRRLGDARLRLDNEVALVTCKNGCDRPAAVKGECRPCYLYRYRHGVSRAVALHSGAPRIRRKLEPLEVVRLRTALREFERARFIELLQQGA